MTEEPTGSLQQLREEWRERLRKASERAAAQVDDMGLADLRALRETIDDEIRRLEDRLPGPGPVAVKGPMSAEEQARHVQNALQYNALQLGPAVSCEALGGVARHQHATAAPASRSVGTWPM